jgi:hypothetical protein
MHRCLRHFHCFASRGPLSKNVSNCFFFLLPNILLKSRLLNFMGQPHETWRELERRLRRNIISVDCSLGSPKKKAAMSHPKLTLTSKYPGSTATRYLKEAGWESLSLFDQDDNATWCIYNLC